MEFADEKGLLVLGALPLRDVDQHVHTAEQFAIFIC
jgi:hypothetical protein